jgi:hypothetical protein
MMATMRPSIRPLTPADIAAVVEFSIRAWAPVFDSFRGVLGERVYQALYPDWATSQARDVEAVCEHDTVKAWVAKQLGRPVGFVALRIDADAQTGEIYMLAVDPLVSLLSYGCRTSVRSLARRKPGVQIPSPPPPTSQVRASPAASGRRSLQVAAAARPHAQVAVQPGGSQRPGDPA